MAYNVLCIHKSTTTYRATPILNKFGKFVDKLLFAVVVVVVVLLSFRREAIVYDFQFGRRCTHTTCHKYLKKIGLFNDTLLTIK